MRFGKTVEGGELDLGLTSAFEFRPINVGLIRIYAKSQNGFLYRFSENLSFTFSFYTTNLSIMMLTAATLRGMMDQ